MKLFFPFFLLFSFIIYSSIKKSNTLQNQQTNFLEKETAANATRRKNIDNMDYITIPYEKLPFILNPSENIASYEKSILSLKEKRILNLNGISNTDLKLTYGAPNLPLLSEYDENYIRLVTICSRWAQALIDEDYTDEAMTLLEIAVELGCDSSSIYLNLNSIYKSKGINKTQYLIDKINDSNSSMKDSIIRKLQA